MSSFVTINGTTVHVNNFRAAQIFAVVTRLIIDGETQLLAFSGTVEGREISTQFLITPTSTVDASIERFDYELSGPTGIETVFDDNLDSLFESKVASRHPSEGSATADA